MAVDVEAIRDRVTVVLSGWERAMCWRPKVVFEQSAISSASTLDRSTLENLIDHRTSGVGTHDGANRPNRRRIGTMLGRGVAGKQFWAVPSGPATDSLLVLDLVDHEFARAVLATKDADQVATTIQRSLTSSVAQ